MEENKEKIEYAAPELKELFQGNQVVQGESILENDPYSKEGEDF